MLWPGLAGNVSRVLARPGGDGSLHPLPPRALRWCARRSRHLRHRRPTTGRMDHPLGLAPSLARGLLHGAQGVAEPRRPRGPGPVRPATGGLRAGVRDRADLLRMVRAHLRSQSDSATLGDHHGRRPGRAAGDAGLRSVTGRCAVESVAGVARVATSSYIARSQSSGDGCPHASCTRCRHFNDESRWPATIRVG